MKLVIIGPGFNPIPPVGWGAVESLIWDYYQNLIKHPDISVKIINETNLNDAIKMCNNIEPDVVHIMYDDYVIISPYLNCKKILYSSHYAYISHPDFKKKYKYYYERIFLEVIKHQSYITIHSISPMLTKIYRDNGFRGEINTICNGAREDLFQYSHAPAFPNKSIYLAKIEFRKGQYKYQTIPHVDFAGNYFDSPFDITNPNYLGEWKKDTLYKSLTEYGNLLLLSSGEADPLVVKEGLIAGLGIVISECCVANLDLTKRFITVIPNDQLENLEYVSQKIRENREYSVANRAEIREYALNHFSWKSIIEKYIKIIKQY
jgi:glycosyltransferase involved in cell wall biosynthesis